LIELFIRVSTTVGLQQYVQTRTCNLEWGNT